MLTCQHLKDYDSKGPNVNSFSIALAGSLLWSHEKNCSCDIINFILTSKNIRMNFSRQPKVCYLCMIEIFGIAWIRTIRIPIFIYQYIFRFQITMNIVLFVNLMKAITYISSDDASHVFRNYFRSS